MLSDIAYRVRSSITVVILEGRGGRFQRLNSGSILKTVSQPDSAGLIKANYQGGRLLVFERDLDDACDRIETGAAASCG